MPIDTAGILHTGRLRTIAKKGNLERRIQRHRWKQQQRHLVEVATRLNRYKMCVLHVFSKQSEWPLPCQA